MQKNLDSLSSITALINAAEINSDELAFLWGRALQATFYEEPEATWFLSKNEMSVFNWVTRARFAQNVSESRIEEVFKHICASESEAAMYWVMGPSTINPHLSDLMQAAGWQRHSLPTMAADLTQLGERPADPVGFTVEHVDDSETLRHWIYVFTAGYELPDGACDYAIDLLKRHGYVNHPAVHFYLGRLQGEPVSTALLHLAGGVAGLYNVSTLPTARRQGFGQALTHATLTSARDMGYPICVLQASGMGQGIYTRLGFQTFGSFDFCFRNKR